jgi:hypothetical protein
MNNAPAADDKEQYGCLITLGLLDGPLRELTLKAYWDAAAEALAQQGDRAFDHPRHDAAIHEAGHVVISAAKGWPVRWTEISQGKRGRWGGWTEGAGPKIEIDPENPSLEVRDALHSLMAGFMSESLFCPQPREGSSLDEKVGATVIASVITKADKADFASVWNDACQEVATILKQHKATVLAIADALEHHQKIRSKKLAKMLEPVALHNALPGSKEAR